LQSAIESGRPTWAEVDLGALIGNYRTLCSLTHSRIIPVVKANAYGHGAVAVSRALAAEGATAFAVAIVEEALELRRAGIAQDILVLQGAWPGQEEDAVRNRLILATFSLESVSRLEEAARKVSEPARVHIKIDTGMTRLGVPWDAMEPFVAALCLSSHLSIVGAFSHLACSEEEDPEFSSEQIWRFHRAVECIRLAGLNPGELHVSNSGGMLYRESARSFGARPGIALYGYPPAPERSPVALKPVLSLKTRIVRIHTIPAGESVGYNRTFIAAKTTRVATLPIGYADGYRRQLSGKGKVIIRDRWAPLLGRISMDLITVEVTDLPDADIGDEVILLGATNGCRMDAAVWADLLGTIPYEILTSLGGRIPRIYIGAQD
jgi:alanine racemase